MLRDEDVERGGFLTNQAGAPKFPPSALLEALLRSHERSGDVLPLEAVERTCTAMARGGIYDQLAGGFARYSVDASWVVPHFEKMLYDNALLLRVYAHWARRTGNPLARRVSDQTARFIIDELGADGMFTSSLDADADGREGLTYVWTPSQLREVLGDDDGRWAANLFDVTETGTFEHGSSVLQLLADPDDGERFDRVRTVLLQPPGSPDRNRAATTRSSPRGTDWRSQRWPRPALRWADPNTSMPQCNARAPSSIFTSWTVDCDGPASAAGWVTAPRSSRTTPRWPPVC